MKGDDLPERAQVVRYVRPSLIREDGTPDGADFRLRPNRSDETGLSINWLDVLGTFKSDQLKELRLVSRLQLRRNGRFAELNVGQVLRYVSEEIQTLRLVHDPLEEKMPHRADPSHSEIAGLPPGESDQAMLLGDLITACVSDMHPAID